jgi:hypothetical protein
MQQQLSAEQIRKLAKRRDDAIESRRNEEIMSYFSDNCEIELPGIKLSGKEGLGKAIA